MDYVPAVAPNLVKGALMAWKYREIRQFYSASRNIALKLDFDSMYQPRL